MLPEKPGLRVTIRGWRAVSVAVLRGKGSHEGICFSQTPASYRVTYGLCYMVV